MFYAHFVLSKKGPLARIWLAAHWDKKLTKAHVFETNIDSSVEAILKPKVKMALRTSGHLMLGVVRIYSRKAKYLLADCNEAFVKIKMAFRPGVVDLPEENREAAVAAITLQENFHDFETTLADLEDIDVQAQFSVNQSRPEEITMREDLGSITLMGDDGFGGLDEEDSFGGEVGEEEFTLIIHGFKTSFLQHPLDFSGILETSASGGLDSGLGLESDPGYQDDLDAGYHDDDMDAESGFSEDMCSDDDGRLEDLDPSPRSGSQTGAGVHRGDVGFDEREILRDTTHLEDPLYKSTDVGGETSLEDRDKTLTNDSRHEKSMDIDLEPPVGDGFGDGVGDGFMDGGGDDDDDDDNDANFGDVDQDFFEQAKAAGGRTPSTEETAPPQAGVSSASLAGEQTTLVHNEDEAFALEPLDVTAVPGGTEKKGKRKRKLIVDEQKGIPSETMKLQLSDTTDIVTTLDLAPPTKKLMHWKETGGVEKLFALPGRPIVSKATGKFFSKNLLTRSVQDDVDLEEEQQLAELSAQQPEITREEERAVPPPSNAPPSVAPPSVAPAFDDLEDLEAMPETEEQDEKRLNKRTQQMQMTLKSAFAFSDTLSFKDMTRNHNRKQAASRFYTLLVLKKHQAVDVQQSEPFGDIAITQGPQFGLAC
nr:hypothetical protein BaRGS_026001 [Batillaria attramentaria]